MWETFTPPGQGPAEHTHTRETEVFRVISGIYRFRCGDDEFDGPPGTVVVLPPADVVDPKMQRRLERVRTLQDRAASASKCGRSVATTGDAGQFEESKTPLRGPDGVHMTAAGASRVWSRVGARVRRLIARRD